MSCFCDYEAPEFYDRTERTARKRHRCCECGHDIQPGERYEHVSGKWDGQLNTFKTCEACVDLRDSLSAHSGCFQHEGLSEEYYEYLRNVLTGTDIDASEEHSRVMAMHRAGLNAN